MNTRIRRRILAALATLVVAPLVALPAGAQAPTPGERWRTTMSMEAMGMKMPGRSQEVCAPKNSSQSPVQPDPNCEISNRRRVGTTESFDMVCTGKDAMSGRMEMTQESPSRWSGKMLMKSADGEMTMNYAGEKLPGECDASEMERKINQMKAQGDAAVARQCMESAREGGQAILFVGPNASCRDAASVKTYCGSARTSAGYNALARQQRVGTQVYKGAEAANYRTILADTGKLCSFDPEQVRTQYCSTSEKKEDWTFLAEECPELAKPIAKAQCAGRDNSNPVASQWVKFCGAFAATGSSAGAPGAAAAAGGAPAGAAGGETPKAGESGGQGEGQQTVQKATPTDAAKEAMQKSKNALKGLFGR